MNRNSPRAAPARPAVRGRRGPAQPGSGPGVDRHRSHRRERCRDAARAPTPPRARQRSRQAPGHDAVAVPEPQARSSSAQRTGSPPPWRTNSGQRSRANAEQVHRERRVSTGAGWSRSSGAPARRARPAIRTGAARTPAASSAPTMAARDLRRARPRSETRRPRSRPTGPAQRMRPARPRPPAGLSRIRRRARDGPVPRRPRAQAVLHQPLASSGSSAPPVPSAQSQETDAVGAR